MTGYNPNRDSGIAEPRSYVEIGKEDLQGLVEEYDCVPVATQRYFAQLVYNVGPGSGGGGGGSQFNQAQYEALLALIDVKDELIGVAKQAIQSIYVDVETLGTSITEIGKIIPVTFTNGKYVYNSGDVDDDNDDDKPEYLINIPGYACGITCYVWIEEPSDSNDPDTGVVSNTMERLYPKLLYIPPADISSVGIEFDDENKELVKKFGLTQIFLNKENEYDVIKLLPLEKRKLRISFIQLPAKN